MNTRFHILLSIALLAAPVTYRAAAQPASQVVLEGEAARVTVEVNGGALTEFRLSGHDANPLAVDWTEVAMEMFGFDLTYRWQGHFLCLDRFGYPSEQEQKNGMPFHGEASQVPWQVVSAPVTTAGEVVAEMMCTLPMAGFEVTRTMRLNQKTAVLEVHETVANNNPLGRLYNFVQHANIQAPFLDEAVILDCNATRGFLYEEPIPDDIEFFEWPRFAYRDNPIDLRHQTANSDTFGVFLAVDDQAEHGWVTACNPGAGLMIGYLWLPEEYPWLLVFRMPKLGQPNYVTFEPTTGYLGPFEQLVARGPVLDRPLIEFIDAGEKVSRSYTAFLAEIPKDYRGVEAVQMAAGEIVITERGADARELRLGVD